MRQRRPNLLFVFADQMRGMAMRCAGNRNVRTPAMDRLAAEGTMFTHAYANCPVCTPSRAMMLTGLYPLTCRTVANDLPLPVEFEGIGTVCRSAGYATGWIGKWHLDGVPRNKFTPPGPRRHGFDFWAAWNCAHNYFNGRYYRDTPEPIAIEGYEPAGQTDIAIDFIHQHRHEPFCLFLSWGPPHNPYDQVPEEYRRMYDPAQIDLRPNVRPIPPGRVDLSRGADIRRTIADYYAQITALDAQLGRLLETLDQLKLSEDTIVVFTSDHGDMLWSQGMLRKQQPWEESINIPFLIRWPGRVPVGRKCDVLMSVADMAPSLLSLMGLEVPAQVEGQDLSQVILGRSDSGPESVFLMDVVTMDEAFAQGLREWRGVRTRQYTYACFTDGEGWVLYDNAADPYQLDNLIDKPSARPLRRRMHSLLEEWLERTGDACLPWQEIIRNLNLVEEWNARERELHPRNPRLL